VNWRVTFYSAGFEEEARQLSAGFVARFLRQEMEKTPRKELEIARRRMKEVGDA
jgi:phage-related protein